MVEAELTPAETAQMIAAYQAAHNQPGFQEMTELFRSQFSWNRSAEFYQGFAKALVLAAKIAQDYPQIDRATLPALYVIQAGMILNQQAEAKKGG